MTKEFYNNFFASGYHRTWQDAPGKLVVLGFLMDNLHQKQKLLDVGCGDGFFLSRIVDEAKKSNVLISGAGIDISMEAIRLAHQSYPKLECQVMDAEALKFRASEFDAVVSYGVLEHVQNPSVGVKEIGRVLAQGGTFAMMMPTLGSYRKDRFDEGWYEDLNDPPQLQWNYNRGNWERFFRDAGLELFPVELSENYGALNPGNFYFGSKP
jgi:ubiquinone/menaquinone biosynthesis C-methylase UbiE